MKKKNNQMIPQHIVASAAKTFCNQVLTNPIVMLKSQLVAFIHAILWITVPTTAIAVVSPPTVPLQEIKEFVSVFERVRTEYVKEHTQDELLSLALQGLLLELDPYSEYLDEQATKKLRDATTGSYVGIGIEVVPTGHFVTVVTPIDDSPAQKAGILSGDIITHVDGTSLKGISRSRIYNLLNGEKGSKVSLTLFRQGKKLEQEIVRDDIATLSVVSELMAENIGYIRISIFQQGTAFEIEKTMLAMRKQGANGWILDLRNNPGGLVQEGTAVADAFLKGGTIMSTKGRNVSTNTSVFANKLDASGGLPTLVIINRGSASAAEIVAAALQDNDRAQIVGETSFGKGSVQSVISLDEERSIRLTTAYYYTPTGNNLNGIGIAPDIEISSELSTTETLEEAIAILQDTL